jgi:hypothetical protein
MKNVDKDFYNRADAHINLSNKQITPEVERGKVSASFMYSVARFNAWVSSCGFNNSDEMRQSKVKMMDYFVTEYRKMLEENLEDYIENFDSHLEKSSKK